MSRSGWVLVVLLLGTWAGAMPAVKIAVFAPDVLVFQGVEMVPVRPLGELWGARLGYRPHQVFVRRDGRRFSCTLGRPAARANGTGVTLPLAPFARAGTAFLPLRPLVAALGGTVTPAAPDLLTVSVPGTPSLTLRRVPQEVLPARYRDRAWSLYVVNSDGTGRRRLSYFTEHINHQVLFSPDGRRFAYSCGERLLLREVASPRETVLLSAPTEEHRSYWPRSFTPDGRSLLLEMTGPDAFYLLPITGGEPRLLAEGSAPQCSPDGRMIVYHVLHYLPDRITAQVMLLDLRAGTKRLLGDGFTPEFNRDGTAVYCLDQHPEDDNATPKLRILPLDGGAPHSALADTHVCFEHFSPDGRSLAYLKLHAPGAGLYLARADGSRARHIARGTKVSTAQFSPDGSHFVYRSGSAWSVRATAGRHAVKTMWDNTPSYYLGGVQFTPDGRQLLYVDRPESPIGHPDED